MKIAKKQVLSLIFLVVFGLIALSAAWPAQADQSLLDSQIGLNNAGQVYGNTTAPDIRYTIAKIINIVLGFLGIIFIGLTIFAGFQYMTAGGNEEKNKKAVGLLTNAVIGVLIILMAWGITRFTIRQLGRAANNAVDYQTYSPYMP
ncbi:MAG: pilin [Candidatus Falkowbacteria bacterium]|nr:pilin [Candidatus Falkowbacteria bacterium]